ncbi:tRNA (guanosine(18)-2'-O)-methyltransferase [Saliniradius amylolyticus]|uniref:tRNA (guanosine(18)-2'-O)-methyltransferase n=1 Tax=Saliniradius amylolyticus TaxID=2183582 RepID=A0A2S2E6S2_9ALTE|nr:tRNA (guanosine(18)-2'-O)-methyltransferase TrmH [Saliniradius amylolyticus]AWL13348.1 tRNA (guanosine(18)-2'-O)-methyltransferase [Saliniradius amylolyticus]
MTPQRYQRMREMLAKRQPDLTICLEEVHKTHNLSAMIRNCDAVGVHYAHVVWPRNERIRRGTSVGAQNWVRVQGHERIDDAVNAMRAQDMQVLVTHLSDEACDFREIDYTRPTGIIFGQEKYGATEQAIALADQEIVIPMLGMVQSLNVSVASALILYEAQRQREKAGLYDHPRLDETECQRILFEGGHPQLTERCRQKGLPYPAINEQGDVEADTQWWQRMQSPG